MVQGLIILFFFLSTVVCLFLYKNIISPPVILSIVWLTAFVFYSFSPFTDSFQSPHHFIFIIGHLFFIVGFVLVCRPQNQKPDIKSIEAKYIIRYKSFIILLMIQIIILSIEIINAIEVVSNNYINNWWFSLKYARTMDYYNKGVLFDYTAILSFVITFILFSIYLFYKNNDKKKLKKLLILQLIIAVLFSLLSMGRTFIFQLIIPIFFIYIISKSKNNVQTLRVLIIFATIAILVFFLINSLKFINSTSNIMNSFYLYMSGSIKAFIDWIEINNDSLLYGENTFRFFLALFNSLGIDVDSKEIVEDFIMLGNGFSTNVYTVYKWYYSDFGLLYALFIQFLLGIFHGIMYKNAYKKGTISSIVLLSISYYPLIMQFFQDQYISLTSTWIQVFFWNLVILKSGIFISIRKLE